MRRKKGWYPCNSATVTTAIFAALLLFCVASAQKTNKNVLNERKEYSILPKNGGKQYHYAKIVEYEKDVDLIVHLKSLSIDGDPDLAVFLGEDKVPDISKKPYCQSDLQGYDVCLISSKALKDIEDVFVEVSCATPCEYSINLIYKKKIEYTLNGKIKI